MVNRPDDAEHEHPLMGGNVAVSVVRVGATVRKPVTAANVGAYLLHLERQGFRHSPRFLGRDRQGRQVLEYIEGETLTEPELLSLEELGQIGAIVRELHNGGDPRHDVLRLRHFVDAYGLDAFERARFPQSFWTGRASGTTSSSPQPTQAANPGRACTQKATATTGVSRRPTSSAT